MHLGQVGEVFSTVPLPLAGGFLGPGSTSLPVL
jgi:hypothetical protein